MKSASLVITTLLTSLHDTTTEDLNKGFKFATGRSDSIAKSTERILEKVEQVLQTLADSPQVIALITVSILVLVATVINLLIGIQNIKMAKALKVDNQQNTKKILEKFTEKWTEAEKLIRGQPPVEEIPSPIEAPVQVPNPKLTITVQGSGYNREDLQERAIILN